MQHLHPTRSKLDVSSVNSSVTPILVGGEQGASVGLTLGSQVCAGIECARALQDCFRNLESVCALGQVESSHQAEGHAHSKIPGYLFCVIVWPREAIATPTGHMLKAGMRVVAEHPPNGTQFRTQRSGGSTDRGVELLNHVDKLRIAQPVPYEGLQIPVGRTLGATSSSTTARSRSSDSR